MSGLRPCHGENRHFAIDPHWKNLLLFHEYFHAETGKGLGAEYVLEFVVFRCAKVMAFLKVNDFLFFVTLIRHQTGWTGLIAAILVSLGRGRKRHHTRDHEHHRKPHRYGIEIESATTF